MRRLFGALVVLALAAAVALGAYIHRNLGVPYRGYADAEQFVDIPPGTGPSGIGRRLVEAGVVRDRLTWRLVLLESGAARDLKAGEYRFAEPLTPREVVTILVRGQVHVRPITFPEGLTIREMAKVYEGRGFGSAASFEQAASDASLVREWDAAAENLEGYLFPDTYALTRHEDASMLVRQMVGRFTKVLPEAARTAVTADDRSVREVVMLASLVEKETARDDERPLVAAVYVNRLRIGMALQCDPTVIYALQRAGRWNGNLTRENLAMDSPYNTYRYPGLPPGPIASPGRASIEAALNPASVEYLYFVSRNDGSHVFAASYDEHRRNVQRYQVEYFRRRGK